MGDVVHALPALTDLHHATGASIDWVVEESFVDIVAKHPRIDRVIPVAIRRWRKNWLDKTVRGEILDFLRQLRQTHYDVVVDAQGLLKSAIVGALAMGPLWGFDAKSARESATRIFYRRTAAVPQAMHAVERQRRLFSALFDYPMDRSIDYGMGAAEQPLDRVMLIHGTTWPSKRWPAAAWRQLAQLMINAGMEVVIPFGNDDEKKTAHAIAQGTSAVVLPPDSIGTMIDVMKSCAGAIAVDTGFAHIATALNLPLVALYGSTDPNLTGVKGEYQQYTVSDHLPCIPCRKRNCQFQPSDDSSKIYPPCFEKQSPESVWRALQYLISLKQQARPSV